MRAQFRISLSTIRHKKLQSILTYLTFAVAALIFSAGISMFSMSQDPFDQTINELNTSHTLLYYDSQTYKGIDLQSLFSQQDAVESTDLLPMCYMNGKASLDGSTIDTYITLVEVPPVPATQDMLKIYDGDDADSPETNEVWVTTQFATANNVEVGDVLELPVKSGKQNYTVSAVVVDPHYSVGYNNPSRVWVKSGEIKRNFSDQTGYVLGIRYKEYSKSTEEESWNKFEKSLGNSFSGYKKGYGQLESDYKSSYTSIGLVLVLFSVVIIIFCLVLLSFTISNSIMSEYSVIGIYRAQGFTTAQIIFTYMLQYLTGVIIAVPLGFIGSIPVTRALDSSLMSSLGKVRSDSMYLVPLFITLVVFIILIALATLRSARRVSRIKPSQAIRYGAPADRPVSKGSINASKMKSLPISLVLAIKEVFTRKKASFLILFSVFITALIIGCGITLVESYDSALSDPGLIGLDGSDYTISNSYKTSRTDDQIYDMLKEESGIDTIVPLTYLFNSSFTIDDESKNVIGYAYDGDMDSVDVSNLHGNNPTNKNEITVSTTLADNLHKDIGDTVKARIEGIEEEFRITGTFFTMNNDGYMFRVQESAVKQSQLGFSKVFQTKVRDVDDLDSFADELKEKYPDTLEIQVNETFIEKFFVSLMSIVELIASLIIIIVVIVCFITIYNSSVTNINVMKKDYGVFKTFGMTTGQIKQILLYKTALISLVGGILGIIAGINAPELIRPSLVEEGFTKFTIVVNWPVMIAAIPFCILITCISVLLASRRIIKINPRNLVSE